MTRPEALVLFGLLVASFPRTRLDEANQEAYTAFLVELRYEAAARDAIMELIRTEEWLPPIAKIRDEYRRRSDRHAPRELPEPDLSDEERQLNIQRINQLRARLGRTMEGT